MPSRPILSARHSRSSTAIAFAGSPGGTSWRATSRLPSASCAVTPWIPATFASATTSTGPVPGTSSSEQLERADPDVDARCSEHDAVRVVSVRVRRLLVQRQPLPEERVERLLVERERPAPLPARALPRDTGLDLEQHRERAARERRPGRVREDSAAAERDHGRLRGIEDRGGDRGLSLPERRLALPGEELLDRRAGQPLDLAVEVDERPAEPSGELPRPASSSPRP